MYLILPVVIVIFVMSVYSSVDTLKVGVNNKDTNGIIAKDFVAALNRQDKFKIQVVKSDQISNLSCRR